MATKKISELEAITEADDSDVLVVVDVSAGTTNKITKGNLLIGSGHSITMEINSNYQLTLKLKNAVGTELSTASIDLPNENAITGITYSNGELVLTRQGGGTSTVDISGLIDGLVTETTFDTFVTTIKALIGISTNTYNSTDTYNIGDIVVQNEKIYIAKEDNITGTFDATKWDEISLYEYQKIQDGKINENYSVIEEIQHEIAKQQSIINQMPQVSESGTDVTLNNTIEADFTKFDIEGNSTQETTEGYQLLNEDNLQVGYNMASYTNKVYTSRTLGNYASFFASSKVENITLVAGTTYYLKFKAKRNSGTYSGAFNVCRFFNRTNNIYTNGTSIKNPGISSEYKEYAYSFIPSENVVFEEIMWQLGAATDAVISITEILLTTDENGEYEDYTGGQASPNPNYEQSILSAGDTGSITEKIVNKNLCPVIPEGTSTMYNRVYTSDGKGRLSLSGTAAGSGEKKFTLENSFKITKACYLHLFNNFSTDGMAIRLLNGNTRIVEILPNSLNKVQNLSSYIGQTITAIQTYTNNGNAFNITFEFMISKNSTESTFVEHEEQTHTIPVQQPMRSIGNVRDKFFKNTPNSPYYDESLILNSWYEMHYFKELGMPILNNYLVDTTQFQSNFNATNGLKSFRIPKNNFETLGIKDGTMLCTQFGYDGDIWNKPSKINKISCTASGLTFQTTYVLFGFNEWSDANTEAERKTAIGNSSVNNAILIAPRKEPLYLLCTAEQKAILDTIPSTYKEQTNIYSEDITPAYVEASGLYDLNDLITRVEVIESES